MKHAFVIFCLGLLNLSYSQAIPTELKKTVGFIYAKDSNDNLRPQGTGFFVSISDSINGQFVGAIYFVTAKHVLKRNTKFRDNIFIRLNTLDSLSDYGNLILSDKGANKNIYIHPDETVDIAVIPVSPNPQKFDYLTLPSNFLSNKGSLRNLELVKVLMCFSRVCLHHFLEIREFIRLLGLVELHYYQMKKFHGIIE
ncbi:hypothetical protein [Maribacter litoralis]|uniref:hypothetical protein n=1 Tax=Maribacter litoralis TaxID=2059726 RepID=UPI003F5CE575